MARPHKDGLDYWPRDVDLREDKKVKLIKAEYGLKGVYLFEEILNTIYRDNGYYKKWDDDDCFLMSEGVGCGCSPELIAEVLQGCLRRSLFNQRVFQMFNVLTSKGIQKRFLKIVSKNREEISIAEEYWLLEKREIPVGTLNKLKFFKVSHTENAINHTDNPDKSTVNAQRKEKKSKVKDIPPYIPPKGDEEEISGESLLVETATGEPEKGSHSLTRKPRKRKNTGVLSSEQQERFEIFWAAWPNKKSPGQAEVTFGKLNPDDDLLQEILAGIERAKKYDHRFRNIRYTPYPSSWLNSKGWQDKFEEGGSDGGINSQYTNKPTFKPSSGFRSDE